MTPLLEADCLQTSMPASPSQERLALLLSTTVFIILALIGAFGFKGFIEGDATNHYLIARFSVDRPANFASVWGRPLCTLLFALPAQIGRGATPPDIYTGVLATRLVSLAMALWVAFVTYRLAKDLQLRLPSLAVIFVFAQPIFFVHAFSEMTEIPFAAVLATAFWAYTRRQWLLMAAFASLLPLGRPEGFGLILLAGAALLWHHRPFWLLVLPIPFLAWNYAGWHFDGRPANIPWYLWVKATWPYSANSAYGRGHPWDFLIRLPVLVGPLLFPLTIIGIAAMLGVRRFAPRSEFNESTPTPSPRPLHTNFWIAAIPLLTLVGHSILWCGGWMGSNGGLRYLVICTPFWALLTARGWEWLFERYQLPRPRLIAALASFLPMFTVFIGISYPNVRLGVNTSDKIGQRIAHWWQTDPDIRRRYPRILSSLPTMSFYLDLDLSRPEHVADSGKSGLKKRTPGTILIWDPILGTTNADEQLCLTIDEIRDAGWIHVKHVTNADLGGYDRADVFLSPTDINGAPTEVPNPPPEAPG
jgi:hypothetical protein